MRAIFLILFLSPVFCVAQKTDVFVKLTDANGLQIKGEATLKGFERWIGVTSITSSGKNNTQLDFTMTVSGASADLKKAMDSGSALSSGQVTVLVPNPAGGMPITSYTIKMEKIVVSSCFEAMGCNSLMNTTVTLLATRIGWTYYSNGAISKKYGWDAESNKEWAGF
jgi:type VI protein secretion system component Hcp